MAIGASGDSSVGAGLLASIPLLESYSFCARSLCLSDICAILSLFIWLLLSCFPHGNILEDGIGMDRTGQACISILIISNLSYLIIVFNHVSLHIFFFTICNRIIHIPFERNHINEDPAVTSS